jgi:hypothetical protein
MDSEIETKATVMAAGRFTLAACKMDTLPSAVLSLEVRMKNGQKT